MDRRWLVWILVAAVYLQRVDPVLVYRLFVFDLIFWVISRRGCGVREWRMRACVCMRECVGAYVRMCSCE